MVRLRGGRPVGLARAPCSLAGSSDGVGLDGLAVEGDLDEAVDDGDLDATAGVLLADLVGGASEADPAGDVDEAGHRRRGAAAAASAGPLPVGVDDPPLPDPGLGGVAGHVADDQDTTVEDLNQGVAAHDIDGLARQPGPHRLLVAGQADLAVVVHHPPGRGGTDAGTGGARPPAGSLSMTWAGAGWASANRRAGGHPRSLDGAARCCTRPPRRPARPGALRCCHTPSR